MRKRVLSILLCFVMTVSLLPTAVFAADGETAAAGKTIYVDAANGDDGQTDVGTTSEKAYKTVAVAVAAAASGDTIQLGEGNYTLYGISSLGHTKGKNLTFIGQGVEKTGWNIGAEVPDPDNFGTEYNGDYSFDGAGTVTFQNMMLRSGSAYYLGFIRADNTVVENCVIDGMTFYWGYTSATFTNTTFNCPAGDYALWTYSSPTMTFDNCVFNSSGKVINVYTDYDAGKHDITVNFKDCTVTNTGNSKKPVLNINDSNMGDYKYILNISGSSTVNGVDVDQATCSRLFGFGGKAGTNNTGRTVVNFGDTTVWKDGKMVDAKAYHNSGVTAEGVSYANGVEGSNNSLYAEGYKDHAFTTKTTMQDKVTVTTKTCEYCGYEEATEGVLPADPIEWDVSRSKTATALDGNDQSTVTLALPSAEVKNVLDVVFVVDNAFPQDNDTAAVQARALMDQLLEISKGSETLDINVGLVISGGYVPILYTVDLADISKTNDKIQDALDKSESDWKQQKGRKGSNIQAGIEAARDMLNNEATASKENKYLILISDGGAFSWYDKDEKVTMAKFFQRCDTDSNGNNTYYYHWCNPGDFGKRYTEHGETQSVNRSFYDLMQMDEADIDAYSIANPGTDAWDPNNGSGYDQYEGAYPEEMMKDFLAAHPNEFAPSDIVADLDNDYVTSREAALYHTTKSIAVASEEANVIFVSFAYYYITPDEHVNSNLFKYTEEFKNYLEDEGYVKLYRVNGDEDKYKYPDNYWGVGASSDVFNSIRKDMIYLVDADSTVVDKMGPDFDFAGLDTMKLTVGGTELAAKIEGDTAYFGDTADTLDKSSYRFKVVYDSAEDSFVWTINEPVTKENPVQLAYTVKLVNCQTAAGTYEVPTNEYAKLTPKDSTGTTGNALEFEVPTVSYTVSGGGHSGGDSTTYYYFAIEKIDAQDSHTLNGAKFGLYLDDKQIATATSNRSGIAMFRVSESDYRKITAKSDLYYQELTAPEGYVVSSDTVSIEKSNLSTNQTTAEKNAETVRNYRSSTPDLLNGNDHFAYVIGYEDGSVRPNGLITRAETATIFFRLLKDDVRDGNLLTSNDFTDVADSYWANTAISTMTGLGIVQGRSTTVFDPNASITRAEFAAICARFDTGTASGTQTFSDISGHWAEKYIQRAAELGWIKGFEDGTFRPDTYITRAQAMTMINRVLNRIPEDTGDLLNGMNVWPDCNPSDWFYLAVQEATNSHEFRHKAGNYETWTKLTAAPDWTRYEH